MSVSLVVAPRVIRRPFQAPVSSVDPCHCGFLAGHHKLFGGVIAHPYLHTNHVESVA